MDNGTRKFDTSEGLKIFEIANNAIYFNDRSDYLTALRQICHVIKPDDETIGEVCIE